MLSGKLKVDGNGTHAGETRRATLSGARYVTSVSVDSSSKELPVVVTFTRSKKNGAAPNPNKEPSVKLVITDWDNLHGLIDGLQDAVYDREEAEMNAETESASLFDAFINSLTPAQKASLKSSL